MKKFIFILLSMVAMTSCGDKTDHNTETKLELPQFKSDQESFLNSVQSFARAQSVTYEIETKVTGNLPHLLLKIKQPQMRSDSSNLLRIQGSTILGICSKQISNLTAYDTLHIQLDKSDKTDFMQRKETVDLKFDIENP